MSLLIAGIIVITIAMQNARQAGVERLSAIATLMQSEISAWVASQQDDLDLIVSTPDVRSRMLYVLSAQTEDPLLIAARDQLQEYISVVASKNSWFEELFLLDASGQVFLSSDPSQVGASHAHWWGLPALQT